MQLVYLLPRLCSIEAGASRRSRFRAMKTGRLYWSALSA